MIKNISNETNNMKGCVVMKNPKSQCCTTLIIKVIMKAVE